MKNRELTKYHPGKELKLDQKGFEREKLERMDKPIY